jgi:hypothetical protein
MFLHYRNELGLEERAPILAARSVTSMDGQMLLLWVRRKPEEDLSTGIDDDNDEGRYEN